MIQIVILLIIDLINQQVLVSKNIFLIKKFYFNNNFKFIYRFIKNINRVITLDSKIINDN